MDASWCFMFATREPSGGPRSLETASGCSAVAYSELGTFDYTKLHVPEPEPSGCVKLQVLDSSANPPLHAKHVQDSDI